MKRDDLKLAIQSLLESYIHPELQRNEKYQIGERYEIKGFDLAADRIMEFLKESGHLVIEEECLQPHERA